MDARSQERHMIRLDEVNGTFSLNAGEKQFQPTLVNDVSAAGVGLMLSQPLAVGTPVKLTFSAGDWAVSVHGNVIWCRRQTLPVGRPKPKEDFRLGIQLQHDNYERNLTFFHAFRTTLKTFH